MLNVVLYAPRIPQNTGQVARACFATGTRLHLVRPLGFQFNAPALRRASVGYLSEMDIPIHADGEAFWRAVPAPRRLWLVTRRGGLDYRDARYEADDWLLLGNETEGLPAGWLAEHADRAVQIPMANPRARCLNLATAAAVVLFEALRQLR